MRVVSHKKSKDFCETKGCEDLRIALKRRYDIAEKAGWRNLSDIEADFLSTDYMGNQYYVSDIRGDSYQPVMVVKFTVGYTPVCWVGTRKKYDKVGCSTI